MPPVIKTLTEKEVAKLARTPGPKKAVHPNLYLQRGDADEEGRISQASWLLVYSLAGGRRELGLGSYRLISFKEAKDEADDLMKLVRKGVDPKAEREKAAKIRAAEAMKDKTFKEVAKSFLAAKDAGWRNAKHRWQWQNTLEALAYPKLGSLRVRDIDTTHVLSVLKPIWQDRTETATRLRGRIESVLNSAKAEGLIADPWSNPARWKGNLEHLLPNPNAINPAGRMAAMDVTEVPALMQQLKSVQGMGARALEFAILTAARSGEVRGATWAEIDLKAKVWTVPGERMKMGREHRVPLPERAIELLKALPKIAGTPLVFPAAGGGMISERTMLAVLRRLDIPVTVHGFRSSFRDWCGEYTNFPREVAEAALAHAVGDAVERAYRRGDALEKRRKLMDAWARFLAKPPAKSSNNVTPLREGVR